MKKIGKIILILNVILIFFSSYINVYAIDTWEITDVNKYGNGDKFKVTIDSREYFDTDEDGKIDVRGRITFIEAGTIVIYTGNFKYPNFFNTGVNHSGIFIEVETEDGSKKGYIHCNNVEEYNGTSGGGSSGNTSSGDNSSTNNNRRVTIQQFISQNNIDDGDTYTRSTIQTKAEELKNQAIEAGFPEVNMNNLYNEALNDMNIISRYTPENKKRYAEEKYNYNKETVMYVEGDYAFKSVAYIYSWLYVQGERGRTDMDDPVAVFQEEMDAYLEARANGDETGMTTALENMQQAYDQMNNDQLAYTLSNGQTIEQAYLDISQQDLESQTGSDITYYAPNLTTSGTDSGQSLDDMINDGDAFIGHSDTDVLNTQELQDGVSTLYNIFLEVGVAVAVIIGLIIGIKFMIGSVEEKAEIKKLLWPYAIGCFVVFGAFGIWKIVLEIMQSV